MRQNLDKSSIDIYSKYKNLVNSAVLSLGFLLNPSIASSQVTHIPSYCALSQDDLITVFEQRIGENSLDSIKWSKSYNSTFYFQKWSIIPNTELTVTSFESDFSDPSLFEDISCFFKAEYTKEINFWGEWELINQNFKWTMQTSEIYNHLWLHLWNMVTLEVNGIKKTLILVRDTITNRDRNVMYYYWNKFYWSNQESIPVIQVNNLSRQANKLFWW